MSKEAHECLAIAMNRLGGKSNTGEGGESRGTSDRAPKRKLPPSSRWHPAGSALPANIWFPPRRSRSRWRRAQSPARAASFPAERFIHGLQRRRHSTTGVGLISPPPHHDIYSIEDLAQLIYDLKNANRRARISVKLVI